MAAPAARPAHASRAMSSGSTMWRRSVAVERLGARRAFAPALCRRPHRVVAAAPLDLIGGIRSPVRSASPEQSLQRRCELWPAPRLARCTPPHAAAEPVGVEDLVEPLPVGRRGAEQRAQRRLAATTPPGRRRRSRGSQRVARLRQPDARSHCRAACARSRRAAAACRRRSRLGPWRRIGITPPCRAAARSPRGSGASGPPGS